MIRGHVRTDAAAGSVLLLLAAAAAWEARTFSVGFLADPVGPRALPLASAAILAGAGLRLLLRPGPARPGLRPMAPGRLAVAVVALAVYPVLLPLLGFVVTTWSVVFALSLLFGGPFVASGGAALLLAASLHVLFVHLLGVHLPVGDLFLLHVG